MSLKGWPKINRTNASQDTKKQENLDNFIEQIEVDFFQEIQEQKEETKKELASLQSSIVSKLWLPKTSKKEMVEEYKKEFQKVISNLKKWWRWVWMDIVEWVTVIHVEESMGIVELEKEIEPIREYYDVKENNWVLTLTNIDGDVKMIFALDKTNETEIWWKLSFDENNFSPFEVSKKDEIAIIMETLAAYDNLRYRKIPNEEDYKKMLDAVKSHYEWDVFSWETLDTRRDLLSLLDLSVLLQWEQFYRNNMLENKDVTINLDESLVDEFWGTANVVSAEYQWKRIAAKIFRNKNTSALRQLILEWMSIRTLNSVWVLPKFYWFMVDGNGNFVLLMDEVKWKDVWWFDETIEITYKNDNYTEESIIKFREDMKKIHSTWFSFVWDSGQLRISEEWEIWFIDILLSPIENIYDYENISEVENSDRHQETEDQLYLILDSLQKNRD